MGQTGVVKSQIFWFWLLSPLLLLLELLNVLGGHRKLHTGSLESRSDLLPVPSSMGQTGVIKLQILCFWLLSLFLLLLEVLNVLGGHRKPYTESLERQSNLPPAHFVGQSGVRKSHTTAAVCRNFPVTPLVDKFVFLYFI